MIVRKSSSGNLRFTLQIALPDLQALFLFAKIIANHSAPGDFTGLVGDLGSGKTTFVQAIAKALGVVEPVTSPTFALLNEYPYGDGSYLVHGDLYRLTPQEIEASFLEFEERFEKPNRVVFLEWIVLTSLFDERMTCLISFEAQIESLARIVQLEMNDETRFLKLKEQVQQQGLLL
jgi:tRNA threonylcarbamoyl adenosine modification protein YjeE